MRSLRIIQESRATKAGAVYSKAAACCTVVYVNEAKYSTTKTVRLQKPNPANRINSRLVIDKSYRFIATKPARNGSATRSRKRETETGPIVVTAYMALTITPIAPHKTPAIITSNAPFV
jgi:hypothetical protein